MTLNNYPGNKSIHGLYQFIINRITPHEIYYEMFAGSAVIADRLPDTSKKILCDINADVIKALQKKYKKRFSYRCENTLQLITTVLQEPVKTVKSNCMIKLGPVQSKATVLSGRMSAGTVRSNCKISQKRSAVQLEMTVPDPTKIFIYLDPPYRKSCLIGGRELYKYTMTDEQHEEMLRAVQKIKCNVMISHPDNKMYDKYLKGWTKEKCKVSYRGTIAYECIYYNYSKPDILHTYKYVGEDCWNRQGIKRKINRLTNKLSQLPALERNAVWSRVGEMLK